MAKGDTIIYALEHADISSDQDFKHDLQFYEEPPTGSLSFDDLERLIFERLWILRILMKLAETNDTCRKSAAKYREELTEEIRIRGGETFADLCDGTGYRRHPRDERYAARRRDHHSHYMLLLCMCRNNEMRRWIQSAESYLFKWRLSALDFKGIKSFIALNKLPYSILGEEERAAMRPYLEREMKHRLLFDTTIFYKVPALEAMNVRHVYVKDGIAYVTVHQLQTVLLSQYQTRLKSHIQSWETVRRHFVDPRIKHLMNRIVNAFRSFNPTLDCGIANVEKLDEIAVTSYPPCMRRLHEGLRETHHLRYDGRKQYTLNLKSMGIMAEDAVALYKNEFTKIMELDVFKKQYEYGFLHFYGLKGSRINYPVPNCSEMAARTPSLNEFHGCPLATCDMEELGEMLKRWGLDSSRNVEIVNIAKKPNCANACAKYFEALHGTPPHQPITTPIDFYAQSIKIRGDEESPAVPDNPRKFAYASLVEESDESESSDDYEYNQSCDDDCVITSATNLPARDRVITKLTFDERMARDNRELLDFYAHTSRVAEEPSYLDYVLTKIPKSS